MKVTCNTKKAVECSRATVNTKVSMKCDIGNVQNRKWIKWNKIDMGD